MKIAGLCFLGGIVALCAWLVIADQMLKSGFARIALGMTQSQVVGILGAPHAVEVCNTFGGTPAPRCAKELSYLSWLSFTDVWTVRFDKRGLVLGAVRYRSP
jgi:hypothetical protein